MIRYSGYAIECRTCGKITRAATLLVAQQKDLEHQARCETLAKKTAASDSRAAAQGDLFGGRT